MEYTLKTSGSPLRNTGAVGSFVPSMKIRWKGFWDGGKVIAGTSFYYEGACIIGTPVVSPYTHSG